MNIYLKKELTINDLPSYYVVFETYNKALVYEITYDYIVIRKDISFSDIKKDLPVLTLISIGSYCFYSVDHLSFNSIIYIILCIRFTKSSIMYSC